MVQGSKDGKKAANLDLRNSVSSARVCIGGNWRETAVRSGNKRLPSQAQLMMEGQAAQSVSRTSGSWYDRNTALDQEIL